jgi:hypothetical protein
MEHQSQPNLIRRLNHEQKKLDPAMEIAIKSAQVTRVITLESILSLVRNLGGLRVRILLAACLLFPWSAYGANKTVQVEDNHMRWENHDAALTNAIAWQEERDGHWVTVVLLTDRPVPSTTVSPGKQPSQLMEETGAQGVAVAIMSGGVPLPHNYFDIGFHNGDKTETSTINGAGGFEIERQSATQIKGRVVLSPFTFGAGKDQSAWSVSFDAPVLFGDARRMDAEGVMLGAGGGQPGNDLLAAQQAQLAMDYKALLNYASPELASFLKDPGTRENNLRMLKGITPPRARILGGLRNGDRARLYWVQHWPEALDNRCIDTLVLKDGKWRSIESACQAE